MGKELSVIERRQMKDLEDVIAKGMATFYEVGFALMQIRDGKFYRESHQTFEAYCIDKWGIQRSRAYQMIEACEVRQDLSTMVDKNVVESVTVNERQVRELSKVPIEELPEIAETIAEKVNAGEKVTAKVIREIVSSKLADPEPVRQCVAEVPTSQTAVENASFCTQIKTKINEALKLLREVPEVDGTQYLVQRERSIRSKLESAKDEVVSATPDRLCGKCNGKKCVQCGNMGWVTARM